MEGLYRLGLNESFHLEIPGAGRPRIPHPKDKRYWAKTDLPWMSIGYVTQVPPIYTLALYNAIANDGKLMKPYFVRSISKNGEALKTFTNHTIQLQEGDLIYLFTDGYADQFGGKDGKKFKYKQLQQVILEMNDKQMDIGITILEMYISMMPVILAGILNPENGNINLSPNTEIAYFGQTNIDRLSKNLTVEEEITSVDPKMARTRIRGICGTMMFPGDKALKKISVLSGGERSRVLMGKIIATPSNLLLLDEPTNHLDIDSVEALKEAIYDYQGGVIMVTHDEMLLRELCTRLIVFQGDKPFILEGDYDYFLSKVGWEEERI